MKSYMHIKKSGWNILRRLTPLEKVKYILTLWYISWSLAIFTLSSIPSAKLCALLILSVFGISFFQFIMKSENNIFKRLVFDLLLGGFFMIFMFSSRSNFFLALLAISILFLFFLGVVFIPIIFSFIYSRLNFKWRIIYSAIIFILFIVWLSNVVVPIYAATVPESLKVKLIPSSDTETLLNQFPDGILPGRSVFLVLFSYTLVFELFTSGGWIVFLLPIIIVYIYEHLIIILGEFWRFIVWLTGWSPRTEKKQYNYQQNQQYHYQQRQQYQREQAHQQNYQSSQNSVPPHILVAFEFFGLDSDCTKEEYKKKYKLRQKVVHPDVNADKETSNDLSAAFNKYAKVIEKYRGWN